MTVVASPWWVRPGLEPVDGRLAIAGHDAEELVRQNGTPLFAYDLARYAENVRAWQAAFASTGIPFRLRFALKANPLPEVLAVFRGLGTPGSTGSVGIDACSPGEVVRAIDCGWRPDEISYTGTNVSERDLDVILEHGVHINLDALSQIERYGRRARGTRIGIRIDPGTGAGYNEHLEYSGSRPTKFGIGPERLSDALEVARRHSLAIDTIHFHAGSGWLADGLEGFERALRSAADAVKRVRAAGHDVVEVNVGGGVGVRARATETPVDLSTYAATVAEHLARLEVLVTAEPGDALAKDASYNGINLLNGDNLTVTMNETGTSTVTVNGVTDTSNGAALGINGATNNWVAGSDITGASTQLTSALTALRSQAQTLGASLSTVQIRQDFTKATINTLQTGSDDLTLADSNQEGANLLALQTRQQLSTTALSLASQADQNVLRLFQ